MTIGEFFNILKQAGHLAGMKEEIGYDLCASSGIDVSVDTVKKWIKKSTIIPRQSNLTIDNMGFIRYCEKYTRSTWPELQKKFSENDEYGFINHSTKDPIIFYRSLLALFYETLRLVPTSLCHILPEKPLVYGRKKELKCVTDIFSTSNYAVITGIGGIGKSYVALNYAYNLNEEEGWIVQHIICEDSDTLRTAVNKLQFDNLPTQKRSKPKKEEENFNYNIAKLKNCIAPALIVLDNLNHSFTLDECKDFDKLKNCGQHIRILITSRNTLYQDKQHVVYISPLDDTSLLELYKYHRFKDFDDHKNYFDDYKNTLDKLFAMVENHTLMITLLAKLPERCSLNEDQIYELLSNNLNLPSETVYIEKDGISIENTTKVILSRIFDISQLSGSEKFIMQYMSLMPLAGVSINLFEELTPYSRSEIRSLINSCWVIEDEETFKLRLHPVIHNIIQSLDDARPTKEMINGFSTFVLNKRDDFPKYNDEWQMYNKIAASSLSAFYNMDIRNPLNKFLDSYRYTIKQEIRDKLKFDPKSMSRDELTNKLRQSVIEDADDEFFFEIIKILIAKLDDLSTNELTNYSMDKLIDESINELSNIILNINDSLTYYSNEECSLDKTLDKFFNNEFADF